MRRSAKCIVLVVVLLIISYSIIVYRYTNNDTTFLADINGQEAKIIDTDVRIQRRLKYFQASKNNPQPQALLKYKDLYLNKSDDPVDLFNHEQYQQSTFRGFETCRMSTCFDYTNCPADKPLKVSIIKSASLDKQGYPLRKSTIMYQRILDIIRNSRFYESDISKACVYVLDSDTLDRDRLSPNFHPDLANFFTQESRFGMNYIVFNLYSGTWPDYREDDFAGLQLGAAIIAKASNSLLHHRVGFDISLPLFSNDHTLNTTDSSNSSLKTNAKKYLISFKGKRYVFGKGSATRNNLYHIDNSNDVMMLTTCRHGKKWQESSDDRCDKDETRYDTLDFGDLMNNSIFCLTPRGRRLGSFRFLESLKSGCIPVVLGDGWVWPFNEIIDWTKAALQIEEAWLPQLADHLRDIKASSIQELRNNCQQLYSKYFSSIQKIILSVLEIVERRVQDTIVEMNELSDEVYIPTN